MKPYAKKAKKVPQRRKQKRYRKRVAQERKVKRHGARAAAKRATQATIDLDSAKGTTFT